MTAAVARVWQRNRVVVAAAAMAIFAGLGWWATSAVGASASAVDYSQCSNGTSSPPPTPDCSWINGILNGSNSQYHEDQVTPQRLTVSFQDTGGGSHTHSVTLRYLDRKGSIHAYDYLASADATMSDATSQSLRCAGIANCPTSPSDTTSITPDTNSVPTATAPYSTVVATHMVGLTTLQKQLHVYGATFATVGAMTVPTHDCASPCTGDDYASTTISFVTPSGGGTHVVQLLFGGHLAAASQADGWGAGLGAASVSGGPYHIKWAAADGASVGNRDNQIMSSAILPIVPQGVSLGTTPTPSTATAIGSSSLSSVSDTATLTVASALHPPVGTMTFDLYGPFSSAPSSTSCVDPGGSGTANRITQLTTTSFTQDATVLTQFTASSGSYDLTGATGFAPGIYQWVAHFAPSSSDPYNLANDGTCGASSEQIQVTQATPTATSTQTITDTVTVTGYGTGNHPTGHVDWYAYSDSLCTTQVFGDVYDTANPGAAGNVNNVLDSSGHATSEGFSPTPATGGTQYYWKVHYDGDTNNAAGDIESCGVQGVTVVNG
jgi:hypothetical protein